MREFLDLSDEATSDCNGTEWDHSGWERPKPRESEPQTSESRDSLGVPWRPSDLPQQNDPSSDISNIDDFSAHQAETYGRRIADLPEMQGWTDHGREARDAAAKAIDDELRDALMLPEIQFLVDSRIDERVPIEGWASGTTVGVKPEVMGTSDPTRLSLASVMGPPRCHDDGTTAGRG